MVREVLTEKEAKLENSLKHKSFLVSIKYSFHLLAFVYFINTILQFIGIDIPEIGCFFHVALFPWLILLGISIVFRYCYVHRLPLYYIATNEWITNIDYYIGIPLNVSNLIVIHLLLVASLIFGYSYYYVKCKLL